MHPVYIFVLSLCVCCGQVNHREENKPDLETASTAVKNTAGIGVEKIDSLFLHRFLLEYRQYRPYHHELYSFYKNRNYTLAWTHSGVPIPQASLFINLIENIRQYGIPIDSGIDYNVRDSLTVIVEASNKSSETIENLRKSVDLALTSLYFSYAPKLWEGVIDPHSDEGIEWYIKRKDFSYTEVLDSILNDIENKNPFIDSRGFHSQYFKLKKALKRYSEIAVLNLFFQMSLPSTFMTPRQLNCLMNASAASAMVVYEWKSHSSLASTSLRGTIGILLKMFNDCFRKGRISGLSSKHPYPFIFYTSPFGSMKPEMFISAMIFTGTMRTWRIGYFKTYNTHTRAFFKPQALLIFLFY
jgi:hypothetical protein